MKPGSKLLVLCLLSQVPFSTASSQGADDYEPVRCISLPRIDHTEVIDNRTIAFYLRGGDILLNRLSRACSGLEDEQRFSHRTTGNQLCSADLITVLHSFAGGLTPGASCPLTMFEPTNEDVIAMLKGEDEDRGEVTVTEIEVDAEAQAEAEARARARARAEEE